MKTTYTPENTPYEPAPIPIVTVEFEELTPTQYLVLLRALAEHVSLSYNVKTDYVPERDRFTIKVDGLYLNSFGEVEKVYAAWDDARVTESSDEETGYARV